MIVRNDGLIELQSVFCPHGDDHPTRDHIVIPPLKPPSEHELITYSIRCLKCRERFLVHAEKRWRISGDHKRTLFTSEQAALQTATRTAPASERKQP